MSEANPGPADAEPSTEPSGRYAAVPEDLPARAPSNPYSGIAVVIMSAGLTVSMGTALVVASFQTSPISEQFAGLLASLGGATVGSIATYLGTTRNSSK
ncbi:hypothetical protein ACIP5Y_07110 [Nocardia sp. NPDC088792]|uniref:hypothetical protein n=1 Tax=Nocardia sp. NPDC088792 TaxID=3364332 RepID=UPI00382169CA